MQISVIIPHLNQPEALALCLQSLAGGTRRPDEVIVVDNGSAALPEGALAAFPGAQLFTEKTPGPGPARNKGVARAKGDVLAFIDADCLADRGWLAAAEEALQESGAMVIGGDVRIALRDPAHLTMIEAYESEFAYRMDHYIAREGFTGTGNLVLRRAAFERVGPFAGIGVAEDRDWGQRARAAGLSIRYVPRMRVYHPARPDFAGLKAKWARQTAHDFAALPPGAGGRLRFALKALALLLSPPATLWRIARSSRLPNTRARALAFLGLCRVRAMRAGLMLRLLLSRDPGGAARVWNRD